MRNVIWVLALMSLTACKKKAKELMTRDLSIDIEASFNQICFVGERGIIVGGQRFDECAIYLLDSDQVLSKATLPANVSGKELYGIAQSTAGTLLAAGYDASLLSSSDTGLHWQFTQNGIWKNFQDIAFRDQDTAFMVTNLSFYQGGIACAAKDGQGSNFLRQEKNFALDDIDFITNQTGYICGYGAILKTIDGGNVWEYTPAQNDYFKSMCWKNESEGIAVGYAGTIMKTTDGGNSWQTCRDGNSIFRKKRHLLAVEQNGNGTYIICGEKGYVAISEDGGDHWTDVSNFTEKDLHGLCFKSQNECAVVGEKGGLFLLKW